MFRESRKEENSLAKLSKFVFRYAKDLELLYEE